MGSEHKSTTGALETSPPFSLLIFDSRIESTALFVTICARDTMKLHFFFEIPPPHATQRYI
ncbi:hypothetical protein GCM10008919_03630 [Selenomonas dianae]|uniref:Uncharacterized protein n=1 Tax=Selenomonas dianae TaxID=135079 RepID=A0ABN0SWG6_9FIRM